MFASVCLSLCVYMRVCVVMFDLIVRAGGYTLNAFPVGAIYLIEEANAMILSTLGESGFPKPRVVLLKGFSEEGFIFFTNFVEDFIKFFFQRI